jgi:hypothetical protein
LSIASSYEGAKLTLRVGKGVASLPITGIRAFNLNVVPDDDEHGCIVGIPFDTEDYDLAMELADRLLELSVVTIEPWNRR